MHTASLPALLVRLGALLLAATAARADVIVADGSVPLQDVVDAAVDGDIVLVKPAVNETAGSILIDAKSLALVADGDGSLLGCVAIRNLPATGQVSLHGLTIAKDDEAFFPTIPPAVEVRDCEGPVWIEACTITSPEQLPTIIGVIPGPPAVLVRDSQAVLITNSHLTGGDGYDESASCGPIGYHFSSPGGPGVLVIASSVTIHGSTLKGGAGGASLSACQESKSPGGPGLSVDGPPETVAAVHVAASSLTGGDMPLGPPAEAPGSGLVVEAPHTVTLRDVVVSAGEGPPFVPDIVDLGGGVTMLPAPARTIACTSPLREQQAGELSISGEAGDLTAIFFAFASGRFPVPGKQGVWSLGNPNFGPVILGVNPTGEWTIPFTAGDLNPSSLQGQSYLMQMLVQDGSGQILIEGNTHYVLVDSTIP